MVREYKIFQISLSSHKSLRSLQTKVKEPTSLATRSGKRKSLKTSKGISYSVGSPIMGTKDTEIQSKKLLEYFHIIIKFNSPNLPIMFSSFIIFSIYSASVASCRCVVAFVRRSSVSSRSLSSASSFSRDFLTSETRRTFLSFFFSTDFNCFRFSVFNF